MIYNFKATAKMLDIEPSKVYSNLNYVSGLSMAETFGVIAYFKEKSNDTRYNVYISDISELLGESGDLIPNKPKTTAILLSLMCCGYIECIQE